MLPLPPCRIKKNANHMPSHVEFNGSTGHWEFLRYNFILSKLAFQSTKEHNTITRVEKKP